MFSFRRKSATEARAVEGLGDELPAFQDGTTREMLDAHLDYWMGPDRVVWHSLSNSTHLDIYMWKPSGRNPYFTFVTNGMSDTPASTDPTLHRVELMLRLPPFWPVPETLRWPWDEDVYFPIRWLKNLARMPSELEVSFEAGHAILNGSPPSPLWPGSKLIGWLLLPPTTIPEGARSVQALDGRQIDLLAIHGLTLRELEVKAESGLESLLSNFKQQDVSDVFDPSRLSCI